MSSQRDERGAACQRNAADPRGGGGEGAQRAGEILHVVACGHVVGVAGFQLVVQLCINSSCAPAVTTSMLLYM